MDTTPIRTMSFEDWKALVETLCMRHLKCTWHDLCGEEQPLRQAYEMGDAPLTFVEWWAEKYDLYWVDPTNKWDVWA